MTPRTGRSTPSTWSNTSAPRWPPTPACSQQGLDVSLTGDLVVVRGSVPTTSVRDGVAAVVGDLVPDAQVVNDVDVTPNTEPADGDVEELA